MLFLPGFTGTRHSSPEQHGSVTFVSAKNAVRHVAESRGTEFRWYTSALETTCSVQIEFLYVLLRPWCPWQLRPDLFTIITAHKGLLALLWVQHDSYLQQHDCVLWCHHLYLVRSCRRVDRLEATRFVSHWSRTFDRGHERHVPRCSF